MIPFLIRDLETRLSLRYLSENCYGVTIAELLGSSGSPRHH